MLSLASINSDPIYKDIWPLLGLIDWSKSPVDFSTDSISSQGWVSMKYSNLVNHEHMWPNHEQLIYWQPIQVIPLIRMSCITTSTGLSKSMNWLWTSYLLTRNPRLVFYMQLLMYLSHMNVRDMSWMLKSMSMHKRDSKGTIKSDFVTSCLTFRGLIPTTSIYHTSSMFEI